MKNDSPTNDVDMQIEDETARLILASKPPRWAKVYHWTLMGVALVLAGIIGWAKLFPESWAELWWIPFSWEFIQVALIAIGVSAVVVAVATVMRRRTETETTFAFWRNYFVRRLFHKVNQHRFQHQKSSKVTVLTLLITLLSKVFQTVVMAVGTVVEVCIIAGIVVILVIVGLNACKPLTYLTVEMTDDSPRDIIPKTWAPSVANRSALASEGRVRVEGPMPPAEAERYARENNTCTNCPPYPHPPSVVADSIKHWRELTRQRMQQGGTNNAPQMLGEFAHGATTGPGDNGFFVIIPSWDVTNNAAFMNNSALVRSDLPNLTWAQVLKGAQKDEMLVISTNQADFFTGYVEESVICEITTESSSAEDGTTTGDGTFDSHTSVTVTATPVPGYSLVNWTEGSEVVSTNASYSFIALTNRTFVANFKVASP